MRNRKDPRTIAKLVAVQKAQRLRAEAHLFAATNRLEEARNSYDAAAALFTEADSAWQDCVAAIPFLPEWSCALAGELVRRETDLAKEEAARDFTELARTRSSDAFRIADASLRIAERENLRARSAAGRRTVERRLAEQAESVTRVAVAK